MRRIIEILQEFQNNSKSISLSNLVEKFSLTIRTLQKDIQRINALLSELSNCKIVKTKMQLNLVGDNCKEVIDILLIKLLKTSHSNSEKNYQLLLYFIWESYPISTNKLLDFTNSNLYSLNQKISLFNNFFQYYHLKLSLKFKTKKGWNLIGCEKDLRFLATKTLINYSYFDVNLIYLYNKLDNLLLNNNYKNYYSHEIIYFLIVIIKRIKVNKLLVNYRNYFLLKQLFYQNKVIENHCHQLINILEKEFILKFNNYEFLYLKDILLLNQKTFSNDLFLNLENFINILIFKKYHFPLMIENFKLILTNFLKKNYLKLLFNFYQDFLFSEVKNNENFLLTNNSYYYGWEIFNIINFAFKKFYINVNFNLFVNDYLLASFNNLYLRDNEKNWKIPLYYYQSSNAYYEDDETNKIVWFIKTKYQNIILKSLDIDNNIYLFNFLNQNYSILIHNEILNLSQFKRIFSIKQNDLIQIQQFQKNFDLKIRDLMFNKVCSSILIFDFFSKQKFYNLKSFLNFYQDFLIRRFKISSINFNLKEAFVYWKFDKKNILLIHKMIPIDNIELPIILVYLKDPLFFHKRNPIHFIFILITHSNTLYQYEWILLYLNRIHSHLDIKVNTVKKLYKIFSKSLEYS